jgi:hypothetical protein
MHFKLTVCHHTDRLFKGRSNAQFLDIDQFFSIFRRQIGLDPAQR